ncbi:MAG: NAD(P)/FAD-dependent oxidoreductase [Bacteroidales bacterium]|nr:NAD(P)/FAD-dependent oxidoreductase [Bacteroidales bacterium]
MEPHEQVIIIGGGPAGIACAVQLKRYGLNPLLLEKDMLGGLVKNAWRIDNYPGFPDGISGYEFVERMERHVERFAIRYRISEIRIRNYQKNKFLLTDDVREYVSEYLIIATGTAAKPIQLKIPEAYRDNVFTTVYPVRSVKGKSIDIVGAGDAAFDYAMTLSKHNRVTIHNRGTVIRCIPALLDIARREPNITYLENSTVSFSTDYTIFATGREPDLRIFSPESAQIKKQAEHDGRLYLIGDVANGMHRQASVAIGDGVKAAMAVVAKIIKNESN